MTIPPDAQCRQRRTHDQLLSHDNPIAITPDGAAWCALAGGDLMEGAAVFADDPIALLDRLKTRLRKTERGWIMLDLPTTED